MWEQINKSKEFKIGVALALQGINVVCEHKEDRVRDGLLFRGEFEGE